MKKRSVRAYAMDCLARREMSFDELLKRLLKAEYPEADALTTAEAMRDENLQSDTRFVEAYIASRIRRGDGPNKIRFDIRVKCVNEMLIEQALACYDNQWEQVVFNVLQKRYHAHECHDYTKKAKAYQYCLRKGHDAYLVRTVIKQWCDINNQRSEAIVE